MKPLTNRQINIKLQRLRTEVKELRDLIFTWGQRDNKELDEVRKRLAELESEVGK